MSNSTHGTVGLDVHARSVRLATVRADELLEERTRPNDHEAIEKAIGRWPGARARYEAGPTDFRLQRHLAAAGVDCAVVAPALVPQRPGDRVKTEPATPAHSLGCTKVGCWRRSGFPTPRPRRHAI